MKYLFFSFALLLCIPMQAQNAHGYKVSATCYIASPGGWDYLTVHDGKLYVSHGAQVNILNESTGDSLGVLLNTQGVHGIVFNDESGSGYTSNGRSNNVTVFDAKTNKVLALVATGENPDAIMYEPFTKMVVTCNGRSNNLSFIDPASNKVTATIEVGGKLETAVSDGEGTLYVNVEDKNEIVAVDLRSKTITHHWPLDGSEGPTGLAYNRTTQRLFVGCDKQLVVMNATNGKVVAKLPIGDGCDGVAFNAKENIIFTSNGGDGNMRAIKEEAADRYVVLGSYPTKRGGRTIAIDELTGTLFIPTADFEAGKDINGRSKMVPGSFQVLVLRQIN